MTREYPPIGSWYRHPDGTLFEVVAVDEDDATIELQHFDGTLDEVDLDIWSGLLVESVGAPEDWSGSVDVDPADLDVSLQSDVAAGWQDPLRYLEQGD